MHYVCWHSCVNLACQFDKARVFTIFTCFPREVEWVDGDTVTAPSRTRIERHEPKWLRLGRFDYLPNVDSHGAVNELQFIDQCDIYAPENVLQELGRLSDATGRYRHECIDRFAIKRHGAIEAGGSVTTDDFRN